MARIPGKAISVKARAESLRTPQLHLPKQRRDQLDPALRARSGKAPANAAREAAMTPRSVMRPVISRAGVTSKP